MDVYENLASTKLDDDVKISVVLREAPQKLRDHLLVNSQQFESDYNKLKAIIQAYLNKNKTWIASDFRESNPMDVGHIGKGKSKGKSKSKSKGQRQRQRKARQRQKSAMCAGKKSHLARDRWSRANNDKMVSEVEAENANAQPGKEFEFMIEHVVAEVNKIE